eukprot:6264012-Heterocapsa_arctica.AAC.1
MAGRAVSCPAGCAASGPGTSSVCGSRKLEWLLAVLESTWPVDAVDRSERDRAWLVALDGWSARAGGA